MASRDEMAAVNAEPAAGSGNEALSSLKKQRDELGFRLKQQSVDKNLLHSTGENSKTIHEEETEGAHYEIDGPLRRVTPYFFTYLTYCKLRWRDRKLIDIFTDEFRDKEPKFYRKAIAEGRVLLNKSPSSIDSVVKNGDLISHRLHRHEPAVTSRPIKIIFENDNIIAIDKPSGLPVHPAGRYRYNTITKIMQHEHGITVHPCNRLDRLTLGLMFLGKNAKGADSLVKQIRERSVRKEYIARVKGQFPLGMHKVDLPLSTASPKHALNVVDHENGKPAETEFFRISYDPKSNTSIVKCHPLTGRTHQIRVHLQYMGHPIANDPIYASEYVWGNPDLGKGCSGVPDPALIARLDTIGKSRACSTWIHPQEDGEVLSEDTCPECQAPLYTDPGPNDLDLWLHAYKYEAEDKLWSYKADYPEWALSPHRPFMELALENAKKCGETQTQFNVGAVLVLDGEVLETGHSRELPGNTHAEQCALEKYFARTGLTDVPEGTELYTTMEPCSLRLSGNVPCVERVLSTRIKTCFVGVVEPDTFVKENTGRKKLSDSGVEYIHIPGYEEECLRVAKLGHEKIESGEKGDDTPGAA
ncbi:pseudouridine synthase [Metschnikowia bicuspidata var. bicuspidata NRRL YB-4993]|uniref:tRNA pseudouridine(32) synthase n=1 Tax=Metschnikowia bicuspidata var. bicuspidata NRRL YB-4993 TaxID=869754 RepID=A0A1A0HCV7_9ASCO|nr:pseudouridine synthase [Metschnikowia bicuspidata var. bicuspidata NRRL YB-4993]OBA21841.1 pseudouridine synthase [Metschnikowia bicuspidata var. bicuspidata NRRL YB-4993]